MTGREVIISRFSRLRDNQTLRVPGDRVQMSAGGRMLVWRILGTGGAMLMFMSLAGLLTASVVPAMGASPGNACDLLTLKDVQGVLGSGLTPRPDAPLTGQFPTMSQCAYSKGGNDVVVVVSLQRTIYDSAQYLKTTQEGMKQEGGAAVTVTPVGGLGDGAFYVVDPRQKPPVFQLLFGKGTVEASLSVLTDGKPDIDAAQKLAKIVSSRLK
jgi:hypothetical protein